MPPTPPEEIFQKAESKDGIGFKAENIASHTSFVTCSVTRKKGEIVEGSEKWSNTATVPNGKFSSEPLEQVRQYGSALPWMF